MNKKTAAALVLLAQAGLPATLPLVFEANRGQTDSSVRYLARGSGSTLWLTENEAVLGLAEGSLRIRFDGGNRSPMIEGEEALSATSSYFIGNHPSRWRTGIPLFGKVHYRAIYPGIDAVFYGNPKDLEYDLIVKPGADLHKIRLNYAGAKSVRIDQTGDLVFTIGSSEIRQHRPRIYQGTQMIEGHYTALGRNRIGFSVDAYDRDKPLTIDPVLTYATHLGGSTTETVSSIAMDAQGNLYLSGIAGSVDFPIVGGLKEPGPGPGTTAYVAKINPAASGAASLIWSTFLGSPTNGTIGGPVAVDAGGNVYAGGVTFSPDFPLRNAFQTSQNCGTGQGNCISGFVAKIAPGGNQLLYSSYLGGGQTDAVTALAVDAAGNAYLAGVTQSPQFPLRGSPFQTRLAGHQNGFLSQVSPDGSMLVYSTFFGGEATETILSIALGSKGFLYLGGYTSSTRYPLTQNAYQSSLQANSVAGLVAVFDLTQTSTAALVYSTYLAGPGPSNNAVYAVAPDSSGSIIAAGNTTDPNFPVTAGAFQSKFGGVVSNDPGGVTGDAFVTKLNPSAQGFAQLTYSSFLGGSANDVATAVAVDSAGRITIAGNTGSSNLPTTADAFECCFSNPSNFVSTGENGFLARVDPVKSGASSLVYSTYLGGTTGISALFSLAMNSSGTAVAVAGNSNAANIPLTSSAFQKKLAQSASNGYVARFDFASSGPTIASAVNAASFQATGFSPGLIVTLTGSLLGPAVGMGPQLDTNGRVATLLAGSQVLVDGVAAPLLYVSAGQINAVAPYELAAKKGSTVFVQVIANGVAGTVFPVNVTDTAPGIFYAAGGQGAILNQDSSYNSSTNPAPKGSYVSIFLTGEGQTNPAGIDGHIASETVDKLARPVAPVGVTIGGVAVAASDIYYAGAAPQNVAGLLQVTVKVPLSTASGSVPVVVMVGSQKSQSGVTVAVQ